MEYIYATLMLDALNKEITEENLKRIIESAGGTPDEIQIKQLLAALEGVDIKEAMKAAAVPMAAAPPPATAAEKKEEAKEEKEEKEAKEEEALEGLGALFG
jgi:large subunit ribosomal protein L12